MGARAKVDKGRGSAALSVFGALMVAAAVVGCSTAVATPLPYPSAVASAANTASPSPGGSGSPSQPLSINPLYSCGVSGPRFSPDVLDGPADAESGTDGAAAALRAAIAGPPNTDSTAAGGLPAAGWLRVFDSGNEVLFLAPAVNKAYGYDSVQATRSDSTWTTSVSFCWVGPDDETYIGVGWELAARPDPQSTTVQVLLNVSDPPCGTLLGWTIKDSPTNVVITSWAHRPPPVVTASGPVAMGCALPDDYLLTVVQLAEPLGNRTLYDGASYPLHPATVASVQIQPYGTWQP